MEQEAFPKHVVTLKIKPSTTQHDKKYGFILACSTEKFKLITRYLYSRCSCSVYKIIIKIIRTLFKVLKKANCVFAGDRGVWDTCTWHVVSVWTHLQGQVLWVRVQGQRCPGEGRGVVSASHVYSFAGTKGISSVSSNLKCKKDSFKILFIHYQLTS